MNSLVDRPLIEELYAASQAGVDDRPHRARHLLPAARRARACRSASASSRSSTATSSTPAIFYFENGGAPEYCLASADWMPRNLDHRVEIAFPILDPRLQAEVREILDVQLNDTVKARLLQPDGSTIRAEARGAEAIRSQERIYQLIGGAQHD